MLRAAPGFKPLGRTQGSCRSALLSGHNPIRPDPAVRFGRGQVQCFCSASNTGKDAEKDPPAWSRARVPGVPGTPGTKGVVERGESEQPPMDRATQKTLGILFGSQFIAGLGFSQIVPVMPMFAAELGLGATGVGIIIRSLTFPLPFLDVSLPFHCLSLQFHCFFTGFL